jgi:hypothetical protein
MLTFLKRLAAAVPTPATDKVTLFVEESTGEPSYKDDAGTVTSLQGAAGPAGEGVPAGGTAGQVLRKASATDYDTAWGADRATVTAVSSASGVVTLDYALGDYFTITLTENVTSWVISNPPGSGKGFSLMVQITQGAGAYTVADPGTTAGGTAIGVSAGSGDIDVLAITSFDNGTTLRSSIAKDFS